jgi:hypothetical protein
LFMSQEPDNIIESEVNIDNNNINRANFNYFNQLSETLLSVDPSTENRIGKRKDKMSGLESKFDSTSRTRVAEFKHFGGFADEDADRFIKEFEDVAALKQIKDAGVIIITFKLCLQHDARDWVDDYLVANKPEWPALKQAFSDRYVPRNLGTQILYQIQNCIKAPNESVDDFTTAFQSIVNKAKPRMSDIQQVQFYVMNLNELSADVIGKEPITMLQAIQYARSAELALKTRFKNTPVGRNGPRGVGAHAVESTQSVVDARIDAMEKRMIKLEEQNKTLKDEIVSSVSKEIKQALRYYNNRSNNNNSTTNNNPPRDIRTVKCFNCQALGHYSSNCPKPSTGSKDNKFKPRSNNYKPGRSNTNTVQAGSDSEQDSDYYNSEDENNSDDNNSNVNPVVASKLAVASATAEGKLQNNQASPMITEAEICGVGTNVIIDTGAAQSLISSKLVNKLPAEFKNKVKPISDGLQLHCATGSTLEQIGTIKLPVKLAGIEVGELKLKIIKNLNSDTLIGNDILRSKFGNVNAADNTVEFRGKGKSKSTTIRLKKPKPKNNKDQLVGSLYLTTKHRIPPNSQYVTANTRITGLGNFRDNYVSQLKERKHYQAPVLIIEAREQPGDLGKSIKVEPSVAVADDELLNHERNMPIILFNRSNRPIVLDAGTRIGRVEAVHNSQVKGL